MSGVDGAVSNVEALGAQNITTVGVVVILVLVVLGVVLSMVITAIIGRVIVGVVVVVAAILVWQQRGHVEDNVNKRACHLDTTFFGIHVDPPQSVVDACR